MGQGPATSRRRLGAELKRFRDEAGLTLEQAAEALECSTSKISRLENGKGLPKQRDVRDLIRLYGKQAEGSLERLLRWARDGARAGWWQEYTSLLSSVPFVFDAADRYAALESDASVVKSFDMAAFHGLLHSADYARFILDAVLPTNSQAEVESLVDFRMRRQEALLRDERPLRLHQIVDESIMIRLIADDPAIARTQIEYVLYRINNAAVTFQVLPLRAGFQRAIQGTFNVVEFDDSVDQDVIVMETHAGLSYLEGDFDVDTFKEVFDAVAAASTPPRQSEEMLRDWLRDLPESG